MKVNKVIPLARKGNPLAQQHLYEQYKVRLFRVCLRYSKDRSDAEDILQKGFIMIFKDLYQYIIYCKRCKKVILNWTL